LLLQQLASKKFGGHENICVVGDEDQSIYKWRGADINNILDFENDYPGAKVVKLEQNYRSTKTIITAASQVISNNKTRKDKTLWTDNSEGLPIVRAQLPDERAEAELVVSEIKRLAEHEGRAYGDFSVFYRTNAQSRQFEDVLRREKIPYQVVGGLRFYDRKEIKDVLSYFRVILNPTDSISLKRIINVPARGIGKTTLDKIDQHLVEMSRSSQPDLTSRPTAPTYWDALLAASRDPSITSAGTAKKLQAFTMLVERLMIEQPKLLLSELYHLILDETGYVRELRQEGTEESMSRIENLEEFDTLVQEFEEDFFEALPPETSEEEKKTRRADLLPMFIEQSTLASDTDKLDGMGSTVKMMTLHSSKGLEFPVVFMVGMEEGLFPSIKQWEEVPDEDIEEERRLCYVGMTRAREQLYMMNVVIRRFWGNVNYQEPSRFFLELPAALLEMKDFSRTQSGGSQFRLGSSRKFGAGNYGSRDTGDAPSHMASVSVIPTVSRPGTGGNLVGQGLDHPEYGMGKITAVEGSGDDQKVTVEFRGGDRRKFLLRYLREYLE
jgi:DNA helicase-2/ATP-dependent DNA helicase PcrA